MQSKALVKSTKVILLILGIIYSKIFIESFPVGLLALFLVVVDAFLILLTKGSLVLEDPFVVVFIHSPVTGFPNYTLWNTEGQDLSS